MGNQIVSDKKEYQLYKTIQKWALSEYDEGLKYNNNVNSTDFNNLLIKRALCLGLFSKDKDNTNQSIPISFPYLTNTNNLDVKNIDINITDSIINDYNVVKNDYNNIYFNNNSASAPKKCINLYNTFCNKVHSDRVNA